MLAQVQETQEVQEIGMLPINLEVLLELNLNVLQSSKCYLTWIIVS